MTIDPKTGKVIPDTITRDVNQSKVDNVINMANQDIARGYNLSATPIESAKYAGDISFSAPSSTVNLG